MPRAAEPATAYPGKLVSAASIASPFQADITDTIARRRTQAKRIPKLVGILATPSPPSVAYAEWTKKACEQVGIDFEIWRTWQDDEEVAQQDAKSAMEGIEEDKPDTALEADVEDLIIAANADDAIHGIMVYYPIFGGRQDTYLQQILDPRKDVEGLHFSYCWNMYHNVRWVSPRQLGGAPGTTTEAASGALDSQDLVPAGYAKSILPCTPLAVVKCLEAMEVYDGTLPYGDRLYGKVITVVNRSEVVGRPLAALLSNDGAKVYSVDLDSTLEFNKRATVEKDRIPSAAVTVAREKNAQRRLRPHHVVRPCGWTMQQCIEASDVVISGVPSASFKIKTEWIKQGAVTVNFSSEKNFEKDVRSRAAQHLPAIGKTTIAMLQRNLLRLVQYRELAGSVGSAPRQGGGPPGGGGGGGGGGADQDGQGRGTGGRPTSGPNGGGRPGSGPETGSMGGPLSRQMGGADGGMQDGVDSPPTKTHPSHHFHAMPGFASRGRSSTMSLPQPDRARERLPSISQLSPTYYPPPPKTASTASVSTASSLWDWRQGIGRRDSVTSGTTNQSVGCTPPFGPSRGQAPASNQQSTLLFAAISPFYPHQQLPSTNGSQARPVPQRGASGYVMSSPSSATPVSPLFIDGLSVEDGSSGVRASWDHGLPRTLREAQTMPSVLERPTKDLPQRHLRSGYLSPREDKVVLPSQPQHPPYNPANSTSAPAGFSQENSQARTTTPLLQAAPDRIAHSRRRRRPPFSYSSLIAQAISTSPEGRMTLREIYTWISNSYPELYSMEGNEGSGWQNTVRHNLSLNKSFVKVARTAQDIYESCSSGLPNLSQAARGKGGWWTLDQSVAQAQLGPNFKGDADVGDGGGSEFGEYGEEGSQDGGVPRAQRRRRTSSFTAAGAVVGEPISPTEHYHPSVLQHTATRGRPKEMAARGEGTMPSVLMQPRTRSAERSLAQPNERPRTHGEPRAVLNRDITGASRPVGRARGYTTGDTEAPMRYHVHPKLPPLPRTSFAPPPSAPAAAAVPSGSTVPSSVYYSPSKRKTLFGDEQDDKSRAMGYDDAAQHPSYSHARAVNLHSQQHYPHHLPQQHYPPTQHHQQQHRMQHIHSPHHLASHSAIYAHPSKRSISPMPDSTGAQRKESEESAPRRNGSMSISDLLNT